MADPEGISVDYYSLKQAEWAGEKQLGVLATLMLGGTLALRIWLLPVPAAPLVGLLVYCAACAGLLAWQHSRWAQSGSFCRWREPLAALMRLAGTGFGAWPAITGTMLRTWAPMRHPVACLLLLVFASGGPSCLHHALSWKMRFGLSALVQAVLVATIVPHHTTYCTAPALADPVVHSMIHAIYGWASCIVYILPLPVSAFVKPDATAECATLLTWLELCIGLLLPVVWEAAVEAQRFHRHQQLRRERGLPEEGGLHAAVFKGVFFFGFGGLQLGCILLVLLAITFDWTALFSIPPHLRTWQDT